MFKDDKSFFMDKKVFWKVYLDQPIGRLVEI